MTYKELKQQAAALEHEILHQREALGQAFAVLDHLEKRLIILREWADGNDNAPIRVALAIEEMNQVFGKEGIEQ